jgi:EmrB/QacA subfamily drug resistance transporter
MVDRFGWQSVFLINVPIGLIALAVAARFVPESSDRDGRSLDLPGQILAVTGLASLTYAFIEANTYGWTSARILICFATAAISLSAFLVVELRSRSPMLQLKFFRNGTFAGANMVGVIISFAFFGVIFFLSLFMQEVQGYSPTKAGILQLPATLGVMAAAMAAGRIVGRIGSRLPMTIGLALLGVGLLMLTRLQPTTAYGDWWYFLLLIGIGNGLVMSPMTAAIMSTVPAARAGMASATSNTMRQVGGVFGVAVLGNLVTNRFTSELRDALLGLHLPPALTQRILAVASQGREAAAGGVPQGVDAAAIFRAVAVSFTSGLHLALWVSGIMLLVGAPIAFATVRGTAPHELRAASAAGAKVQGEAGSPAPEAAPEVRASVT